MDTQIIGLDIGRGYVKGYSLYNENEYSCLFKSVYGDGRNISLEDYRENPIYIEIDGTEYFVGALSEKESMKCIRNARSEEHTSELQSRQYLVCRLLLE